MNVYMRNIMTAFLFQLLLLIIIGIITIFTFSISSFKVILTKNVYNLPFLVVILLIILTFSVIIGILLSQHWKQRLKVIERALEKIRTDQMVLFEEKYQELASIESELLQIEQKFLKQIEHTQRLATERANEREKSLQEVVMQERNRLARDLHDSVSQQLFAASMMMSAIHETIPINQKEIEKQVHLVEKMIHQAQLEMRALLLHLRPVALKGKALQEGINDLIIELSSRLPLKVSTQIEDFSIEKGVEDQLFRILQEALSNALRHAEAKNIHVMLIKRDQLIILRIVDDGKGFNMKEVAAGSYGLETMQERSHDLSGRCKIVSLPNHGTKVEVQVPIVE